MSFRTWLAVGLLAASWTAGLGYYAPASFWPWAVMVLAGTGLLLGREGVLPQRGGGTVALVLLLPVLWFIPWPQKSGAVLLAVGLAAAIAPVPRGWPKRLAPGAIAAGGVLLAQSAPMYLYEVITARCHDLPAPLAAMLGNVATLFGSEAGTVGSTLAIKETTTVHPLGATWDLLLPPTVVCFVAGAAVMLALELSGRRRRWRTWLRATIVLVLTTAVWLPLAVAIALGLYAQRVALTEPTLPLCTMNQFVVWWLPTLLLAGPVLLAWWFVKLRPSDGTENDAEEDAAAAPGPRRRWVAMALAAIGAAMLTFPWTWDPIGQPKQGRIRFVERASQWEPTDAAYDENTYGEKASYTYRVIYDYASHYFTMSRISQSTAISGDSLADCDVLVLKTPTLRMAPKEVDAIEKFVKHGGGLLMIGDHTNVFKSSTFLNDVARRFGFSFRNDLLFRVGTPYEQPFRTAAIPHPAVMHVREMDFAVSCSIDPGMSWGRSATGGRGLWNLQAEYQNENYHPPAEYRPEMRRGPFVQLWAARYGKGRVLAFTDSTIFSNFCIFQPGKSELMLNMLSWLNHGSPMDQRGTWLLVVVPVAAVGLFLLLAGLGAARRVEGGWAVALSAGLFGGVVCCLVVTTLAAAAMPAVQPAEGKEPFRYVIDRGISEVPLSKGAFIQGDGAGYGLLEQWITRVNRPADANQSPAAPVGYTARRAGNDVFSGDVLVLICPTRSVSQNYCDRLVQFVRKGGRLLVLDSPSNVGSTANSVLWPFGLSMVPAPARGKLNLLGKPTGVEVAEACQIAGGTPIAEVLPTSPGAQAETPPGSGANVPQQSGPPVPVAAEISLGQGTVTAIGFASAFNDAAMGREWLLEPNEALRQRYDVLYSILRRIAGDRFSGRSE